jgi:hypothetical protein
VHDVYHVSVLMNAFQLIQGRQNTYYCGAHTVVNSQEHGLISGMAAARQLGADYPFADASARRWFNFWGRSMFGARFTPVRAAADAAAPVAPAPPLLVEDPSPQARSW